MSALCNNSLQTLNMEPDYEALYVKSFWGSGVTADLFFGIEYNSVKPLCCKTENPLLALTRKTKHVTLLVTV